MLQLTDVLYLSTYAKVPFDPNCSLVQPDAVGMWTRTAGAPCQTNLLAFLAQVQNRSSLAPRDTSYSLHTSCGDQFGHAAVTTAIADFGLSDFSRTVPSNASEIEGGQLV